MTGARARTGGSKRVARRARVPAVSGLVLALAACTLSPPPLVPPSPASSATGAIAAEAWVTTADGSQRMSRLTVISRQPSDAEPIVVDPAIAGQRIDGFGAALTHSSAAVLQAMPAASRSAVLRELFDPAGPMRLSVLRIPIGASDFVPTAAFTLDDLPAGETDWELKHFSIATDREALLPVLKEVLKINPRLVVIASPWSPPAWLKTSDSLEGGRLLDEQRAYDTYARYLVRFVEEYRDAGVPIGALTVQNEPQLRHPDGYPGTDMPVAQEAKLIEALGPALQKAALDTRIFGYDHNWELNPSDAAAAPPGEDPAYQYPADLLGTPAAQWIDGIAYHCYYGAASAQRDLHAQFPTTAIWVTECSGSHAAGAAADAVFADTLQWQATNLLIASTRDWANAVLTFNLALDPSGGPHVGGCDTCTPIVTVADGGTVTRNAEYYVLAHASRFVPPGAVEIASDSPPGSPVDRVAFRDPDGTRVVVAYNTADEQKSLTAVDGSRRVTVTAPARSLVTITWKAG